MTKTFGAGEDSERVTHEQARAMLAMHPHPGTYAIVSRYIDQQEAAEREVAILNQALGRTQGARSTMAILTPEKLVELRELAKAATPGPWSLDPMFGVVVADADVITETRDFPRCDNARFIAAANPETVLALLEAARC